MKVEEKNKWDITINFIFDQNSHNFFCPKTKFNYVFSKESIVRISIFIVLGKEFAILINKREFKGRYELEFSLFNLSSEIYLQKMSN